MQYAVINKHTGRLIYLTESPDAVLPAPFDVVATMREDIPNPLQEQWSSESLSFVPIRRRTLTKLDLLKRFSDVEFVTFLAATKQSIEMEAWWTQFLIATPDADGTSVDLDDPRLIAGLQRIEGAGIIGTGRAAQILA